MIKTYYATYGTSPDYPYQNGWTVIYAKNENEARQKHAERHGLTEHGTLRFAFIYSYEEWNRESNRMRIDGNLGAYMQEI